GRVLVWNVPDRAFAERAAGNAARIAEEAAARRIGRGGGQPGRGHRLRVGPARVAVDAAQVHGAIAGGAVEVDGGREPLLRPVVLIPAPALQPFARGQRRGGPAPPLYHLLPG